MVADDDDLPTDRLGSWDLGATSLGAAFDAPLRALYRSAESANSGIAGSAPPDPFDDDRAGDLRRWLTDSAPDGGPGLTCAPSTAPGRTCSGRSSTCPGRTRRASSSG